MTVPCCLPACLPRFSSEFHVQSTLDGQIFILNHFHKAYHHYIKVVPTMYDVGRGGYTGKQVDSYQMLSQVGRFGSSHLRTISASCGLIISALVLVALCPLSACLPTPDTPALPPTPHRARS